MNRRTVLSGVTITISPAFAGCFAENDDSTTENGDGNGNTTESTSDSDENITDPTPNSEENNSHSCSFHAEIIEEPPKDATVVSAKENNLIEVEIIRRILDNATDPDEQHGTATRPSGEYEQFSVVPNSEEEYKEGRNALESLPDYRDDEYPSGKYIEYNNTIVAITEDCLT